MWKIKTGGIDTRLAVLGSWDLPIYLVRGEDGVVLVDAGAAGLAPRVLSQLDRCLEDRRELSDWVITHSHFDHCGVLGYLLPLFPRVRVHVSAATAATFRNERAHDAIRAANALTLAGLWPDWHPAHRLERGRVELRDVDFHILEEGDALEVGRDLRFRVLATPGHARCQMALFEESDGRAFVADALGECTGPGSWCPLLFGGVEDYSASIAKVAGLEARELCLGHNARLSGKAAVAAPAEALEAVERFASEAASLLESAGGDPETAALALSDRYSKTSAGFLPRELHVRSMRRMIEILAPDRIAPSQEFS